MYIPGTNNVQLCKALGRLHLDFFSPNFYHYHLAGYSNFNVNVSIR